MALTSIGDIATASLTDNTAAGSILWETAGDWDNAVSESGVVHESVTDTDHSDDTIVKQGYEIASPFESANLALYYPFHEDSGTTANDFSGNNDDATISGATVGATGLLGTTSYDFDGSDDVVTSPSRTWTDTGLTLSAWVNADFSSSHTGNEVIIRMKVDGDNNFELAWPGSATTAFGFSWSNTFPGATFTPSTVQNVWIHLVAVRTVSPNEGRLYVDGVQRDTASFGGDATGGSPLYIGERDTGGDHFDGLIADVRAYDTAFSDSQVSTLFDVVDAPGSLETATKSFASGQTPDLIADVSLNTVASFDVDVIGSPSGTPETNTVTVDTDGENTYTITWGSSHADFRVKPKPANGGDFEVTPNVNKLELTP